MSVCPKCGYIEPFDWKNSPHQLYMQYLNPDEAVGFFTIHQTLAKALAIAPKYAKKVTMLIESQKAVICIGNQRLIVLVENGLITAAAMKMRSGLEREEIRLVFWNM